MKLKRRSFIKLITTLPLLPSALLAKAGSAQAAKAQGGKAAASASSVATGTAKLPDYAGKMIHSDMDGVGPDGKPTGQTATYTGASRADAKADTLAKHKMTLTKEEQDILNGKEGKEKAKGD